MTFALFDTHCSKFYLQPYKLQSFQGCIHLYRSPSGLSIMANSQHVEQKKNQMVSKEENAR